jgi:hypothetical protein
MTVGERSHEPVDRVLERLENVRRCGNGWTALCPAHGDTLASLSVAEGTDGRALLHCFAGCEITEIVAALDLEMCDLFPRGRTNSLRKAGRQHGPYT